MKTFGIKKRGGQHMFAARILPAYATRLPPRTTIFYQCKYILMSRQPYVIDDFCISICVRTTENRCGGDWRMKRGEIENSISCRRTAENICLVKRGEIENSLSIGSTMCICLQVFPGYSCDIVIMYYVSKRGKHHFNHCYHHSMKTIY